MLRIPCSSQGHRGKWISGVALGRERLNGGFVAGAGERFECSRPGAEVRVSGELT